MAKSDPYGIFSTGTYEDKADYILNNLVGSEYSRRDQVPWEGGMSSPYQINREYMIEYMQEGNDFPSMALDFQDVEKIKQSRRKFFDAQQEAVEGAMEQVNATSTGLSGGASERRKTQIIDQAKENAKEQRTTIDLAYQDRKSDAVSSAESWLLDAFPSEDLVDYQTMKQQQKKWIKGQSDEGDFDTGEWFGAGLFKDEHKFGTGQSQMDQYNKYIDK